MKMGGLDLGEGGRVGAEGRWAGKLEGPSLGFQVGSWASWDLHLRS